MYSEALSVVQREVLIALVELYEKKKRVIKGKEIAEIVGRGDGTIRNIMPPLKTMSLIEAIPGPKGGYLPTCRAYECVKLKRPTGKETLVPAYINGKKLNFNVTNIEFLDISLQETKALIRASGDITGVQVGNVIHLGPATESRLIIEGKVVGRDDLHKELLLMVSSMISIPEIAVRDLVHKKLITVQPVITVRKAAGLLAEEGIRGAPVVEDGKIVGMFTSTDLGLALSEGKEDRLVKEVMSKPPVIIDAEASILEAVHKMQEHDVGRIIVVNEQKKPIGIVTRTDILKRLSHLETAI